MGNLKAQIYINNPHTLEELSKNVTLEIQRIPRAMLERSIDNFDTRLQEYINKNRCNFLELIIFFKNKCIFFVNSNVPVMYKNIKFLNWFKIKQCDRVFKNIIPLCRTLKIKTMIIRL